MMRRRLLILALSMAMASTVAALQNLSNVETETIQISNGLYVLVGAGGNIGLSVGADGALLVDDQYAPLTEKILAAVAELTSSDVEFVINTHWHGDHTGGNENLGRAGALIVAHDNVRESMSREVFLPLFDSRTPPAPPDALPVVTFSEETTFHWNDETIRVFHVPNAHTDGDAIVHFESANVIHMGDILWTSGYPRVDSGVGGGSVQGVIDAVERVLSIADAETQFIPGHGSLPPRGTSFLEEYVAMLSAIQERVRELIDDGLSEDAIVAARPTAEFDARWGNGFMSPELFSRVVYTSLASGN